MLLQIHVAVKAMPCYTLLPTVSEYMIESGWTRCYSRIGELSWILYFVSSATYLVLVEFGIYWMHRELHDIKPLYKHLHATHHIYNKQNTLSPFAGKYILISSHVKDWLHSARFVFFLFRACVSPTRWDTSGFTACDSSVYSANSFHNPSRSFVYGSDMDSEHP